MSQRDMQLKKPKTRTETIQIKVLGLACLVVLGVSGCDTEPDFNQARSQEQLGLGIVLGTRGYIEVQKELALPEFYAEAAEGQVVAIEGAAYIIQDVTEHERRIPFDQNTTIDRPAHVGDWIEAYLDDRGRAVHIRNIDEEFMAREEPLEEE